VEERQKIRTQFMESKQTPLCDIFQGQLRLRTWKTGHGKQSVDNIEPFLTLELDVDVSVLTILMNFRLKVSKN